MSKTAGGENSPRILVYVGGDLIGDAIIKLPFVYGLRQAFPSAHITWLAGGARRLTRTKWLRSSKG